MKNGNGNIIKKHVENHNFTIVDNTIFRNKELSLKGKGLLTMLLSLPDNWRFREIDINFCTVNRWIGGKIWYLLTIKNQIFKNNFKILKY